MASWLVKGEDHKVFHNTVFDTQETKRSDLIILDDSNVGGVLGGGNRGTSVINNAGDVISSQRASAEAMPAWVDYGSNFNGNDNTVTLKSQLSDPNHNDFRPKAVSLLNSGHVINDAELVAQQGGALAYTGAYRLGQSEYWIPGRRLSHASHPIPAVASAEVAVDSDLIWRPAYQAVSYDVYLGTDENALPKVGSQTHNVYTHGTLAKNQRYFWRVDAVMASGEVITGEVWHFDTPQVAETVYSESFETSELPAWHKSHKVHVKAESAAQGAFGLRMMKQSFATTSLSTKALKNISIGFSFKTQKLGDAEGLTVSWSSEGTDWQPLSHLASEQWQNHSVALPKEAEGHEKLFIKFSINGGNASQRAHLDDINIKAFAR